MNKNSAIYVRTANHSEEGKTTLRKQVEQCQKLAKESGYTFTHTYQDICSGTLTGSALQKLLKDVADGKIQTIITPNHSRFTRNTNQLTLIYSFFSYHDVNVLTLN